MAARLRGAGGGRATGPPPPKKKRTKAEGEGLLPRPLLLPPSPSAALGPLRQPQRQRLDALTWRPLASASSAACRPALVSADGGSEVSGATVAAAAAAAAGAAASAAASAAQGSARGVAGALLFGSWGVAAPPAGGGWFGA